MWKDFEMVNWGNVCVLQGTSALTSQFRSSGIWSRWIKSEKIKPPKENSSSRMCAGWPIPVCCPGGTGQEELQGSIWVHWPSYAGNLDSLIPLPNSCQEQLNAQMLNLPTLYVPLGPKTLEPTGLKGMSNACVTNKHPEQSLCLHTDSVTATPPTMTECSTVLADAAQLP